MNNTKIILSIMKQIFIFTLSVFRLILKAIPFLFIGIKKTLLLTFKGFRGLGEKFKNLLRFSLTFKITFIYALLLSLLLFLSSTLILLGFRFFLMEQAEQNIQKNNEIILNYIEDAGRIEKEKINEIANREKLKITIYDKNKRVIFNAGEIDESTEPFYFNSRIMKNFTKKLIITSNNEISSVNDTLYIEILKDLSAENLYIKMLSFILIIVNTLGLILILIMGSKASKKMFSPIERMTQSVKAITISDLNTRLDVKGSHDELKELAETFNEMIDRIQDSYERQNQFVSDASHELRTPIAVIQGYINLLDRWGKDDKEVLDEAIVAIKGESENMKDLVEKLLFLARSDKNTLKIEKEEFLMNELIEEIVKETKLIDTNHRIIVQVNEKVSVYADRKLIKQALRIFIDNSLKYTARDGIIKINSYKNKRQLVISVEDNGIGIPKEDIPYIFNRFYRSDKSRTKERGGHGLGLSIAKLIIDKHNGTIKINSQVKVGTKISIFLPLNQLLSPL